MTGENTPKAQPDHLANLALLERGYKGFGGIADSSGNIDQGKLGDLVQNFFRTFGFGDLYGSFARHMSKNQGQPTVAQETPGTKPLEPGHVEDVAHTHGHRPEGLLYTCDIKADEFRPRGSSILDLKNYTSYMSDHFRDVGMRVGGLTAQPFLHHSEPEVDRILAGAGRMHEADGYHADHGNSGFGFPGVKWDAAS